MTSVAPHPAPEVLEPDHHADFAAEAAQAAHLAPGRWHAPHFHGEAETAPGQAARHAGAHRHHLQSEEFEALERLIAPHVMPSHDEIRREARRTQRRNLQPHRRFRPTFVQCTIATSLLGLWMCILFFQSRSVALRNLDQERAAEIAVLHQEISETRHAIASLASSSSLRPMAGKIGWTPVPSGNFDDVSTPRSLVNPAGMIPASLTTGGTR